MDSFENKFKNNIHDQLIENPLNFFEWIHPKPNLYPKYEEYDLSVENWLENNLENYNGVLLSRNANELKNKYLNMIEKFSKLVNLQIEIDLKIQKLEDFVSNAIEGKISITTLEKKVKKTLKKIKNYAIHLDLDEEIRPLIQIYQNFNNLISLDSIKNKDSIIIELDNEFKRIKSSPNLKPIFKNATIFKIKEINNINLILYQSLNDWNSKIQSIYSSNNYNYKNLWELNNHLIKYSGIFKILYKSNVYSALDLIDCFSLLYSRERTYFIGEIIISINNTLQDTLKALLYNQNLTLKNTSLIAYKKYFFIITQLLILEIRYWDFIFGDFSSNISNQYFGELISKLFENSFSIQKGIDKIELISNNINQILLIIKNINSDIAEMVISGFIYRYLEFYKSKIISENFKFIEHFWPLEIHNKILISLKNLSKNDFSLFNILNPSPYDINLKYSLFFPLTKMLYDLFIYFNPVFTSFDIWHISFSYLLKDIVIKSIDPWIDWIKKKKEPDLLILSTATYYNLHIIKKIIFLVYGIDNIYLNSDFRKYGFTYPIPSIVKYQVQWSCSMHYILEKIQYLEHHCIITWREILLSLNDKYSIESYNSLVSEKYIYKLDLRKKKIFKSNFFFKVLSFGNNDYDLPKKKEKFKWKLQKILEVKRLKFRKSIKWHFFVFLVLRKIKFFTKKFYSNNQFGLDARFSNPLDLFYPVKYLSHNSIFNFYGKLIVSTIAFPRFKIITDEIKDEFSKNIKK